MKKAEDTHVIEESVRIELTKTLLSLRDDGEREEVSFPSTLSNTERKFLHELAGKLGLKSRSSGKDENRFITVSKSDAEETLTQKEAIPLKLSPKSLAVLKTAMADISLENVNIAVKRAPQSQPSRGRRRNDNDIAQLRKVYFERQTIRSNKPSFGSIQKKRALLPSYQLREEVCKLIKDHQITLVSGETGDHRLAFVLADLTHDRMWEDHTGSPVHSR